MPKPKPALGPWRNAIVRYAVEPIDVLIPHPQNPKHHPPEQRDALIGSLNEFGIVAPALVNERSNRMLDGHKRLIEAQDRGQPTFPVLYVDVPIEKEGAFLASFDAIGWMASNDQLLIATLLESAHVEDSMLADFLDTLRQPEPKQLNDDDADLTPPAEPITKPGDLWLLGEHRLLCGDAMQMDEVVRLLDGNEPRLLITDPPYGVAYDPTWRDRAQAIGLGPGRAMIPSGDDEPHDWSPAFTPDCLEVAYCWAPGGAQQYLTQRMLESAGYEIRQQIIWVKPMAPLSRSAYHWRHEPCWYAVRRGATAGWIGDRSETTVIEAASPTHIMSGSDEEATSHATQKPVEIIRRPMQNHEGDVYDPFVGSGTTIIAAEQLGRTCYAMEIDAGYCDVTVRRWEHITGKKAVLDGALVQTHA